MKVLMIEDSEVVRTSLRGMLDEISGVSVVGEVSGAAGAMPAIEKLSPDLLILDIRLQDGNGIEVLEKMKQSGVACETIVLTNYDYPQYRRKCEALGVRHFFDKSTQFQQAIEVIKKLAGKINSDRGKKD